MKYCPVLGESIAEEILNEGKKTLPQDLAECTAGLTYVKLTERNENKINQPDVHS